MFEDSCVVDEDEDEDEYLCIAQIHLNQSLVGQCVELSFEGMIAGIPTHTSRNVCVPPLTPHTGKTLQILRFLACTR